MMLPLQTEGTFMLIYHVLILLLDILKPVRGAGWRESVPMHSWKFYYI